MGHPLWPLFDLRIRTPRLELRLPDDEALAELCAVARAGIHPPEVMPFGVAWTDKPSPQFEREFAQHHWLMRATWQPNDWTLNLAAFLDGRPVGSQSVRARDFAVLRTVDTGSWLGAAYQGRGLGKELRLAALVLAFEGLAADVAESGAFADNAASAAVSRALGYEENGFGRLAPRGEPRELRRFRITRARWLAASGDSHGIAIEGLDTCRDLFGAG